MTDRPTIDELMRRAEAALKMAQAARIRAFAAQVRAEREKYAR